jgi:hypothetical protein
MDMGGYALDDVRDEGHFHGDALAFFEAGCSGLALGMGAGGEVLLGMHMVMCGVVQLKVQTKHRHVVAIRIEQGSAHLGAL